MNKNSVVFSYTNNKQSERKNQAENNDNKNKSTAGSSVTLGPA